MARAVKQFFDRRADIIQAARRLFETKEYDKTTIQDVIEALGIAKGTIYHYFKSKEALLEAVIEEIVETNRAYMQSTIDNSYGNALDKMKLLVKAGSIAAENKNVLEHLHRPGNHAMHTRLLAAAILKQAPLYAELIKQGCREGLFRTKYPLESAEFILSGVQFLTDIGIYPWSEKDLDRRIKAFSLIVEQLLQAPAGSFKFLLGQLKNS